jgi:hypothetical protein
LFVRLAGPSSKLPASSLAVQFAATSPLPDDHVNNTLVVRAGAKPDSQEALPTITKSQYVDYLKKYCQKTEKKHILLWWSRQKINPKISENEPWIFLLWQHDHCTYMKRSLEPRSQLPMVQRI